MQPDTAAALKRAQEKIARVRQELYPALWQRELTLWLLGSKYSSAHTDVELGKLKERTAEAIDKLRWLSGADESAIVAGAVAFGEDALLKRWKSVRAFQEWVKRGGDRRGEEVEYWDGEAWVKGKARPGRCPAGWS